LEKAQLAVGRYRAGDAEGYRDRRGDKRKRGWQRQPLSESESSALHLAATTDAREAEQLLDALPANLETDERAVRARARLGFAALLRNAPPPQVLEAAIASNPDDLHARHLLGVHAILAGDAEAGLGQFLEMLRRNREFEGGLPRKALIDAFQVIEDADLVGRYRRRMSSLLLV